MYYLFRIASIVIPRIPYRYIPLLSRWVGWFAWIVAVGARKQATENITHVLQDRDRSGVVDRREVQRTVQGIFRNSVRNYLEAFSTPRRSKEEIMSALEVEQEDVEVLEAALAQGRGVLLFSAHLGPFELLAHWLAIKGYKVIIPVENLKNQRLLELMLRLRRSHGVEFMSLGGSAPMRLITRALRENQIVLLTADRAVQGMSVELPFFGAKALLPNGVARLAQKTGATLVAGFGRWRDETHVIGRMVPLDIPEEDRKRIDVIQHGIVEKMEQFIGEHPEQWMVYSRVWTTS